LITNYHARWVLPITSAPIADGTVSVDGARIAYVGARSGAPAGAAVELGSAILLPGLVNTHTHLELTAMRGLLPGMAFVPWIRALTQARAAALTDESMLDGARWGIAQGLAAGITTYADTSSSGVVLQAMRDLCVRGIMYQEVFGPAAEQRTAALEGLRARVELLRPLETDLVRLGVSPHAPYTVHEDLLIDTAAFGLGAGLPVAIHLAESDAEVRFLRDAEGPFADGLRARGIPVVRRSYSPVHLLVELGVVLARPLLIHCVKMEESDIAFVAQYECPVAHCPASNAELGHGIAPIRELLDAGVTVGLGSDSLASNDRLDILYEARLATLLQSARLRRPHAVTPREAVTLATFTGARALGLERRVGSLEIGKEADLAAFPVEPHAAVLANDPWEAVLGAAGRPAVLVTVAGQVRVRDGRVLDLDLEGLGPRVRASAAALASWRQRLSSG
jgi:5-methylthioadenosine/S-adenosylhomocysteine deaminase